MKLPPIFPIRSPWGVTGAGTEDVCARPEVSGAHGPGVPRHSVDIVSRPRLGAVTGVVLAAASVLCSGFGPGSLQASPRLEARVSQSAPVSAPGATRVQEGAPQLEFHADGTFKILQLTDIHFQPEAGSEYADQYKASVEALLEAEHPDMVVITGDVLYWSGRPMNEYFDPVVAPMIQRRIPWAVTLGNHDSESWFTGEDVMTYLKALPGSLCQTGPEQLGGSGNYAVEVRDPVAGKTSAVLYMLDSHDHAERFIDYARDLATQLQGAHARPDYKRLEKRYGDGAMEAYRAIAALKRDDLAQALRDQLEIKTASGRTIRVGREDFKVVDDHQYGWLSAGQVRWYGDTSAEYARKSGNERLPSLMFFHIPLAEYPSAWTTTAAGSRLEDVSPQGVNTGMFATIRARKDVVGVFAGHDHLNDYVGTVDGVALGYGRKTGTSVYGPAPMERGGRVIVLHEGQRGFDTWIRTVTGKVENKATFP